MDVHISMDAIAGDDLAYGFRDYRVVYSYGIMVSRFTLSFNFMDVGIIGGNKCCYNAFELVRKIVITPVDVVLHGVIHLAVATSVEASVVDGLMVIKIVMDVPRHNILDAEGTVGLEDYVVIYVLVENSI